MFVCGIVPLDRATSEKDHIVIVDDTAGKRVCWCGPYTRDGAVDCVALFCPPAEPTNA